MSGRPVDGSSANEGNTEDLLRELIPEQTSAAQDAADELPVWTSVPADEGGSINPSDQSGFTLGTAADAGPLPQQQEAAPQRQPQPQVQPEGRRRGRAFWVVGAAMAGLLLVALAFGVGVLVGSDTETDASNALSSAQDDGAADGGEDGATVDAGDDTVDAGDDTVASPTTEAIDTADTSGDSGGVGAVATGLTLSLQDYAFTLDGVVPSDEIKDAIEMRMGLVFAEFGTSNLTVDPGAAPAPWLEGAPGLINTMILLHDGTIEITEDAVNVSGTALQSDFEKLQGALSADNGFPPITITDQEIVDKEAPWLRAVAMGDTVTLTGELADETMQATLVEGAKAIYGTENVTDQTSVNPERHNRFLIMRFPSNLAAYKVFGEFDIRGENESFIAILESGLEFNVLETELTAESQERLSTVMFTLTRNPLPVTVVGHTDGVGSAADNQALSEARAQSVAEFLVDNGVLPENITVSGRGETEPVADNRSQDGRALNRRVEISIGLNI